MRTIPGVLVVWAFLGLLLLCSCATEKSVRSGLPADVKMNQDAGRGGLIIVKLRLEDGEELPFAVDTGSPWTLVEKSLVPKLGKQLEKATFWNFGVKQEMGFYATPRLSLGNDPLKISGPYIGTYDPDRLSFEPNGMFKGILGMDCLEHYCIQLDFSAGKLRFIDGQRASKTNWGRAFPLSDVGDGCCAVSENLAGTKGVGSLIDTGCNSSGWLTPDIFQQWTNRSGALMDGAVCSPRGVFGGEKYPEVELDGLDAKSVSEDDSHTRFNGIGLHFMSQHLVTLDFPNRTMYLKKTSDFALADKNLEVAARKAGISAYSCAKSLKRIGQLPGWTKKDLIEDDFIFHYQASDVITIELRKEGDSFVYHYGFNRKSKERSWKLQKAWRTNENDRVVEEYVVKGDGR
jgi:hypothetical protein